MHSLDLHDSREGGGKKSSDKWQQQEAKGPFTQKTSQCSHIQANQADEHKAQNKGMRLHNKTKIIIVLRK